jgi:hypothetical protein
MTKAYTHHIKGQNISSNSDAISIEGHIGRWYVISEAVHKGQKIFMLEHEEYGDEAAHIAVDIKGSIVCEDIYDDFPECLDY